jgi:hypothetical protein
MTKGLQLVVEIEDQKLRLGGVWEAATYAAWGMRIEFVPRR